VLHSEVFARPNGKGNFVPLKYRPPVEATSGEYPLMLMTGRRLYHYHATMTRKVDALNVLLSEELAQVSPADAGRLGVATGDLVRVASAQGEVQVRARVTDAVPPGMVAMAFHFADCPTNRLISSRPDTLDPVTKTPAYKTCPVNMTKVQSSDPADRMVSALHRAAYDPAFRAGLSNDPEAALAGYGLAAEEQEAVAQLDIESIEAHTGRLDERLRQWLLAEETSRNGKNRPSSAA
jgi:predicted molibdopterin-dependent oxidoreductase YjgC